jgi:type II secretory pathway component GspD/PulD (secretin)
VDPNIFYSGLESVSGESFGSTGGSTGGGGGGTGGGGGGGGGGGSSSSSTSSGAAIAVVNAFPGASTLRSTGTGGGTGGGGGGGGATGGVGSPVGTGVGGTGGNANSALTAGGGVRYVTTPNLSSDVSVTARAFFTTLGVNLNAPVGKSVFFNDRLGLLIVKATEDDLDTIERAIQAIDAVPPQVHIKTRFIEVQQTDNKALGFDWYLGNFINGAVQATGGSAHSLNVPVSAANPLGAYPGSTALSEVAATAADGQIGNLVSANQGIPTLATVTGILTNPNFRVVLHALESRSGFETLAEPEVTTISGRQTEMRATQLLTVITSFTFTAGSAPVTAGAGAVTTP